MQMSESIFLLLLLKDRTPGSMEIEMNIAEVDTAVGDLLNITIETATTIKTSDKTDSTDTETETGAIDKQIIIQLEATHSTIQRLKTKFTTESADFVISSLRRANWN